MKKPLLITIIVAVVLAIGIGAWAIMRHGSKNGSTPMNMSNGTANSSSGVSSAPAQTNKVVMQDFVFSPGTITVKKGTAVTWTNNDQVAHTVTESDGQQGPSSGNVAPGASYSFTFNTVGTFKYRCTIHASMTGTVMVTN